MAFDTGDRVAWNWGPSSAEGTVTRRYEQKTTVTIKGSEITRNGTPDCPAYLIEQDDGDRVLKLHSELQGA